MSGDHMHNLTIFWGCGGVETLQVMKMQKDFQGHEHTRRPKGPVISVVWTATTHHSTAAGGAAAGSSMEGDPGEACVLFSLRHHKNFQSTLNWSNPKSSRGMQIIVCKICTSWGYGENEGSKVVSMLKEFRGYQHARGPRGPIVSMVATTHLTAAWEAAWGSKY